MRLGFMGFGEAAFFMASGLSKEGLDGIVVYDHAITLDTDTPARLTLARRVKDAGVTLVNTPQELAAGADTIVLVVPALFAEDAAAAITAHMGKGQTLVDVCSSSPNLKEQIADTCAAGGLGYVDSPMLGPLPVYGHKVPIAASGPAAQTWHDAMTPFGMVIDVVDGPAGLASRIKLSRSIFTKGFEALLVETFQFACKNGVQDVVMKSIGETMDKVSFFQSAERYLAGDLIHAARRAHELEDAITIMHETGVAPLVSDGALARLNTSAKSGSAEKLGGEMPKTLEDVYAIWRDVGAI